ncbi:MAG: FkbM family methyltransferase [Phycisphaeraceae bacterium]
MATNPLAVRLSRWLLPRMAPVVVPHPIPGWYLGFGECRRDLRHRARKLLLRSFKTSARLHWIDDLELIAYPYNEVTRSLMMTGLYDPTELSYLQQTLQPGMTFIDAGANLGLYSLVASRRVGPEGRVIAIEPSCREHDRLLRHIDINHANNIEALKLAVADDIDTIGLKVADDKHAGHNTLGSFAYEATRLDRVECVRTTTIDQIVSQRSLSRVDLIKLDIEGAELAAIRGASETLQRFQPELLVEFNEKSLNAQGATAADLWSQIESHGYEIGSIDNTRGAFTPTTLDNRPGISLNLIARHKQQVNRLAA